MAQSDDLENDLTLFLTFVPPRYCATPFPPYRFGPGLNPPPYGPHKWNEFPVAGCASRVDLL